MAIPPLDVLDLDDICARTETLWEELRGQRLFITGGTGFFGCWLLESFAAANRRFGLKAQMTVLTRSPARFRSRCPHLAADPAIVLVEGDVRSFRHPEGDFPFVIHAAAETGEARTGHVHSAVASTLATIFDGTRQTLEFAATHGTRSFLMVSSGAVYGAQPARLTHLPETYTGGPDTCLPGSAYGEAKRAAEALCVAYASPSGMACKIARCFAFVGPHLPLNGSYAIGNFIRCALDGRPIRILSDGTPLRSYLYVTDLTVWLWTILVHGRSLEPVNVGSGKPISIRELAEAVKHVLRPELEVDVMTKAQPDVPIVQYVPLVERAWESLGLKQTVELKEAIQRTAAWYGWQRPEGVAP